MKKIVSFKQLRIEFVFILFFKGPKIKFESQRMSVDEPTHIGRRTPFRFRLVRSGDLSSDAVVRIYSQDSSAEAGEDYERIDEGKKYIELIKISLD